MLLVMMVVVKVVVMVLLVVELNECGTYRPQPYCQCFTVTNRPVIYLHQANAGDKSSYCHLNDPVKFPVKIHRARTLACWFVVCVST